MTKQLITFFFSLTLLASIVTPSYLSLVEEACEITKVVDLGEEEEKKGKEPVKEMEVKIYYSQDSSLLYIGLEKKKRISFYSKNYTSFQKRLTSPPPELLA